jgi:hypothetical protein
MKLRMPRLVESLLLVASAASAARASTIFNATGLFADGATLSGTIAIDTVLGQATGADLVVSAPDATAFSFVQVQYMPAPGVELVQLDTTPSFPPSLLLAFSGTLAGYSGGAICSETYLACGGISDLNYGAHLDSLVSGSLSPAPARAPEPDLAVGAGLIVVSLLLRSARGGKGGD